MTKDKFTELLTGPLSHPLPLFALTRLTLALAAVLDATGQAGDDALEAYCRARTENDDAQEKNLCLKTPSLRTPGVRS